MRHRRAALIVAAAGLSAPPSPDAGAGWRDTARADRLARLRADPVPMDLQGSRPARLWRGESQPLQDVAAALSWPVAVSSAVGPGTAESWPSLPRRRVRVVVP